MWWCKQKIWRGCFHKSTAATKKFADSQLPTKYYLVLPLFHRLFRKLFSSVLFWFFFQGQVMPFFLCLLHDFKTWAFISMYWTRKVSFLFLPLCSDMCVHLLNIQKRTSCYSAIFQKDASSVAKKGGVYHCLAIELGTFFCSTKKTTTCLRLHCSFMSHLLFRRFHSLSQLLQWEDFYFFATKQLLHSKPKRLQIESLSKWSSGV